MTFSTQLLNMSDNMITMTLYGNNALTSDQTAELFNEWTYTSGITSPSVIATQYFNFSQDNACQALANMINAATSLETLYLYDMDDVRPITVTVTTATSSDQSDGTITINDATTGDQILSNPTSRTTSVDVLTAAPTGQEIDNEFFMQEPFMLDMTQLVQVTDIQSS